MKTASQIHLGFDLAMGHTLIGEMRFLQCLAQSGKIIRGIIVAQKNA